MQRFWSKVDKTETCWLWKATLTKQGYGKFRMPNRTVLAHRFSYELNGGVFVDGLVLDHLCRVRNCVRPDHLEQVTFRENVIRSIEFRSPNIVRVRGKDRTHCLEGHEFTAENTETWFDNFRRCKTCLKKYNLYPV